MPKWQMCVTVCITVTQKNYIKNIHLFSLIVCQTYIPSIKAAILNSLKSLGS